ncbi:hypothetical protein YDYSY3_19890 [Paenibacillus chitinolyticus]|uniref:ABC-2 transporter permease n=1 Tax=Paenibacillus chitinolyticus TaxID=79263 RepID=UPI0026E4A7F3|nr:ABC-2 transporter permease [Paenibacillus chitinolyticus]GKS10989.1 hypothetical protein YDYSY3_19890 [Paenibacillus chitinolyticus]
MSAWSNVWWLAKQDLKMVRYGYIWSLLYYLNAMFVLFVFMKPEISMNGEVNGFLTVVFNLFVLSIIQVVGYPIDTRNMNYWKNDAYTKRILQLKMLPVRDKEIVTSRFLVYILYSSFFILLLHVGIRVMMSLQWVEPVGWGTWLGMIFFWWGTVLAVGSFYLYGEMSMKGKTFFRFSLLMLLATLILSILLWWTGNYMVWPLAISSIERYGVIVPACSVVIGATALGISWKILGRKIGHRDLFAS